MSYIAWLPFYGTSRRKRTLQCRAGGSSQGLRTGQGHFFVSRSVPVSGQSISRLPTGCSSLREASRRNTESSSSSGFTERLLLSTSAAENRGQTHHDGGTKSLAGPCSNCPFRSRGGVREVPRQRPGCSLRARQHAGRVDSQLNLCQVRVLKEAVNEKPFCPSCGVSHVFLSLNGGSPEKAGSFDFPGGSQFCGQIDHLGVGCPYSSSPPKWCRGSVLCPQVCKRCCYWIRLTFPAGRRLSPSPLPWPGVLPELMEPFIPFQASWTPNRSSRNTQKLLSQRGIVSFPAARAHCCTVGRRTLLLSGLGPLPAPAPSFPRDRKLLTEITFPLAPLSPCKCTSGPSPLLWRDPASSQAGQV